MGFVEPRDCIQDKGEQNIAGSLKNRRFFRVLEGGAAVALADKTLVCRDCGQEFVFSAEEQEFYQSHGLQNEPRRCPECRASRRRERWGGYNQPRQMFTVTCADCGVETTVPFEPKEGRPVYCKECYVKQKKSG